jgi:hypothetical protein
MTRFGSRRIRVSLTLTAGLMASLLAGCEQAQRLNPFSDSTQGDSASAPGPLTNGVLSGRAFRVDGRIWGDDVCPEAVPMVMNLENGQVRGEVRSPRDRTVTIATFQTFADANGGIAVRLYFLSRTNEMIGQLRTSSFRGTLRGGPESCVHSVQLNLERG